MVVELGENIAILNWVRILLFCTNTMCGILLDTISHEGDVQFLWQHRKGNVHHKQYIVCKGTA